MSPSETDLGRSRKHLENLPRKSGHHALEGLVAGVEGRVEGAVELIGFDDGIVGAHVEHVLACLGRTAIDREGVVGHVDGAPVFEFCLVGRLDLPVLD